MYIVFEPICFSDTSLNIYIYISNEKYTGE